jgi:hypothetical protein
MADLADPDAVDGSGQIGTRMPFQQFAKLVHRHVTIATQTRGDRPQREDRAWSHEFHASVRRTALPGPGSVWHYLDSRRIQETSRGNREFLVRTVRFLRDAGIRQFLDIGAGLPTSPNTHKTAQEGHPDARVVYVDNDPVVSVHAEALMADNVTTTVVRADLRDVDEVLG